MDSIFGESNAVYFVANFFAPFFGTPCVFLDSMIGTLDARQKLLHLVKRHCSSSRCRCTPREGGTAMHRSKRGDSIAEHAVAKAVRYARVQHTLAVCNSEGEAVPC